MTRARTHMCHSSYHPWKWALHWGGSNTGSNHTQCGHKAKPIRSMLIHFCWSSQMWSFARLHANTVVSKHELLLQLPSWIQDTAPEGTKEMAGHKWTGKKQKPLGSKSMVVTLTKGVFTVGQQVSPHLRCRCHQIYQHSPAASLQYSVSTFQTPHNHVWDSGRKDFSDHDSGALIKAALISLHVHRHTRSLVVALHYQEPCSAAAEDWRELAECAMMC